jgi:hypothetical protein
VRFAEGASHALYHEAFEAVSSVAVQQFRYKFTSNMTQPGNLLLLLAFRDLAFHYWHLDILCLLFA